MRRSGVMTLANDVLLSGLSGQCNVTLVRPPRIPVQHQPLSENKKGSKYPSRWKVSSTTVHELMASSSQKTGVVLAALGWHAMMQLDEARQ